MLPSVSPFGFPNRFGENVVLAAVTHHAVFQVKLPPVFAAVNLVTALKQRVTVCRFNQE